MSESISLLSKDSLFSKRLYSLRWLYSPGLASSGLTNRWATGSCFKKEGCELSKKKLLIIGPDPVKSLGGMATVIRNILQSELLNERYDIEMYPSYIDGPLLKRGVYSLYREASFRLRRPDFDICHVHVCSGTSTWRKMRYIEGLGEGSKRVVLHVHGGQYDVFWNGCSEAQKDKIIGLCASVGKVIVLSEEWRAIFLENRICEPSKLAVLHNAVEIPAQPVDTRLRQDVLFLGRLGARKSPDVLLRAAKTVLKSHPQVRFRFGGDGDIAKYKVLAEELGISDNCDFLGWTTGKRKEDAIRASRIYCLPSKHEGMPMSVLEAMSYGVATIATPVGGVPQVIQDGINGYLMPIDDSAFLANRINELLDDSGLAERIGSAGRKTIEESFGMDSYAQTLAEMYESVANE